MKKRKYLSEFGLHVFTSYRSIIPIENLEFLKERRDYYIYSILSSPKIRYLKDSFRPTHKDISFTLERQIKDTIENIEISKVVFFENLDHTKLKLKCDYPYNKLEIEINDTSWLSNLEQVPKNNRFLLNAHDALGIFVSEIVCEYEVLYIGQAFGKDGERIATDRLKSHSTLQRILTDYYSSHPDKQLHIFLFEFTPHIHTSFDGLTKQYTATETEESYHFNNAMDSPLIYKQIINITEAAMINYFKPPYNINFVDNFPDIEHKGYSQYYDLDYNSLVVEIDLEFDTAGSIQLFTATNRINSSFDYIKYELFNDPNRKSMYDVFEDKK